MKNKKIYWTFFSLSILAAWISWFMVYRSFYWGENHYWSLPIVSLFFSLVFFSLLLLIESRNKFLYLATALALLPAFFLSQGSFFLMVPIWICGLLIIFWGVEKIETEKNERIKLNIGKLIHQGMPLITTGLCLIIAGGYYFSLQNQSQLGNVPRFSIQLPSKIVDIAVQLGSQFGEQNVLKEIEQGITVDEFIKMNLGKSIQKQEANDNNVWQEIAEKKLGRKLTEQEQQMLDQQLTTNANDKMEIELARNQLAQQLGVPLTGEEKMQDVVSQVVNKRIEKYFNGNSSDQNQTVPISLAIALFLTTRTLAFLLSYLLIWTIQLFFHIMIKMKIFVIGKEIREVEVII